MAHIQDRWERNVGGERVRTTRYGKGKRWQARYRDPDGHERTKDFARKADAERFLATITADVLRGAFVDPNAGKVTFSDFAERWLHAQTFTESTREAIELRLRLHAIAHFGQRELRSIKPSVIQAWIRGLQQELAPTYVRTIFTNVSTVFTAAVDDGLIATNPCKARSVKLPPREQRKIQPWPVERVEAVIDALPDRYRAIGVVAAGCGLRQGEVFGLRVCDVDFLRQQLHVEQQVKLVRSRLVIDRPKRSKTRVDRCRTPSPSSWPSTSAHTRRPVTTSCSRAGSQGAQPQLLQPRNLASRPRRRRRRARQRQRNARPPALLRVCSHRRRRIGQGRRRVPRSRRPRLHPAGVRPPVPVVGRASTPSGGLSPWHRARSGSCPGI